MENIDVVILCGGLGKRLRAAVSDRPKAIAQVDGEPFLDILIKYVASFGFKRFVLCIGYMGESIIEHYNKGVASLNIVFSKEKEPQGTGGAIKLAQELIKSDNFLVLNGDSFCKIDFDKFYEFHLSKKAMLSVALAVISDDQSSGIVTLDSSKRMTGFKEKIKPSKENYRSVGIYLMDRKIFKFMDRNAPFSLEVDIFPALVEKDCYGYCCADDFIDIGTPENLAKAGDFLKKTIVNKR